MPNRCACVQEPRNIKLARVKDIKRGCSENSTLHYKDILVRKWA